jgi:hypothetical protein
MPKEETPRQINKSSISLGKSSGINKRGITLSKGNRFFRQQNQHL